MAKFEKTKEFEIKHVFDPVRSRHFINGKLSVLHCHHYATLYTQLADDVKWVDGPGILKCTAEDVFYEVLGKYFNDKCIEDIEDMVSVSEDYYKAVGLGRIKFISIGESLGKVELYNSHLDEGWIKKWGKRETPVNFIARGFIAAVFSLVNCKEARSYDVNEIESLVTGKEKSVFKISIK